jgi:hypothetical protein
MYSMGISRAQQRMGIKPPSASEIWAIDVIHAGQYEWRHGVMRRSERGFSSMHALQVNCGTFAGCRGCFRTDFVTFLNLRRFTDFGYFIAGICFALSFNLFERLTGIALWDSVIQTSSDRGKQASH